jgi:uncharacterized protein
MNRVVVLLVLALLAACSSADATQRIVLRSPQGDDIAVTVEIADSAEKRQTGLMERTKLPEGTGMLFVFDEEKPLGFWMKNTLIPLDILFFSADGQFISTSSMIPCEADPCPPYLSGGAAKYALEVPAGYVRSRGIETGWRLVFGE